VTGAGEPSVRSALRGCAGDVRFVRQSAPAGTADAALCGAEGMDEDFLVVYGDVVTDPANLREVIRRFEEERPLAAALVQIPSEQKQMLLDAAEATTLLTQVRRIYTREVPLLQRMMDAEAAPMVGAFSLN